MPQALATFLVSVGVSALAASVIATAVTIAIAVGLQALFGPSRPKPSDGQQEVRQAVGSRRRHYGIVHTSGQVTFFESRNGTLAKVITLGTGREGEILEHRINDDPVTVDGAGTVTTASFKGAVHIYTRSGDDDQAAIGELTAKFSEWTTDHRQRGCAHAALICDPVKQENFSEVYNNRVPEYSQVRKSAFVYDPRLDDTAVIGEDGAGEPIYGAGPVRLADDSTWPWSDNWALVTADYWAHRDGYGGGYDNVNWTNIAQEAEHCDAEEITFGGGAIARWRIWASYSLASEERRRVLADMLRAGDGFAWQDADARFNLMSGRWEEPDATMTDDHILGMTASLGPESRFRTSAVKVIYTEAAIGYREQESATVVDPAAEDDPDSDPQAVEAYYAPHHNQAWRLGNIILAQLGDRWRISCLLNLYGLNLLGRRFCRLETGTLGVYAYFKIDGLRLDLVECTVEATLAEVKPGDYDAPAEPPPPTGTISAPGTVTIPAPTGLALSAVQITLGETNAVAIEATWDDPGRPDLIFEAQYRPSAGGTWLAMTVDNPVFTARSGPVNSGTAYDVQVRSKTITGRPSAWSASVTITPSANNIVLVEKSADMTTSGATAVKSAGVAGWSPGVRSAASITGSCRVRFHPAQANKDVIVGINAAATTDTEYFELEFGLACDALGDLNVFESSGAPVASGVGTYAAGEELWVEYDSSAGEVRYYSAAGANLLRTKTGVASGLTLYLDSVFYQVGTRVDGLDFEPI